MRVARAGFVLALSLSVLGLAMPAEAALKAYICDDASCDGVGDIIIDDDGAGDLQNAITGVIQIAGGTVAGYEVTANISTSKPVLGSAEKPHMKLSYDASNVVGSAAKIWFYASDTDFIGITQLKGVFNASSGQNITASVWGDSSNLNLDLSNLLDSSGPGTINAPTGNVFLATGTLGSVVNPYSLTIGVSTNGGSPSGDLIMKAPEPATLSLFGLGLLGLANVARRRMRRQ